VPIVDRAVHTVCRWTAGILGNDPEQLVYRQGKKLELGCTRKPWCLGKWI